MQISMPPAKPPAGTRDSWSETLARPPRPLPPGPLPRPGLGPARSPYPTPVALARHGGVTRRVNWRPVPRPPPDPEVGRGFRVPGRPGKAAGPAGRGVRAPEEPTCQDSLPRVRQFGLSGCGCGGGRQSAGRRHCGVAVGKRRGSRRWPRVRAPALKAVCRGGGGWLCPGAERSRQPLGSAPRGSSRAPPPARPLQAGKLRPGH